MVTRYLLSGLLILLTVNRSSERMYQIHSTKAVYESFSDKFLVNATVSRTKGLTIYINVIEDLHELYTDVGLVADMNDQNVYDFDVVKRTINTCKLFKEPTYEPVVQFLYKLFLNSGNFPTECPIKKGLYFIKDMKTDPKNLPQLMSEKKAILTIKHLSNKNKIMTLLASYQVHFTVESVRSISANVTSTSGTNQSNSKKHFRQRP